MGFFGCQTKGLIPINVKFQLFKHEHTSYLHPHKQRKFKLEFFKKGRDDCFIYGLKYARGIPKNMLRKKLGQKITI